MDQVNQAAQTPYRPVLYRAKVMVTQTSRPMRCVFERKHVPNWNPSQKHRNNFFLLLKKLKQ